MASTRSGFTPVGAAITTTTLSVDHIGEADRFAYFREAYCQGASGVMGELALRARLETGHYRMSRGLPEISQRSLENWICFYQEVSDGVTFQYAGNEFTTRPRRPDAHRSNDAHLRPASQCARLSPLEPASCLDRTATCRPRAGHSLHSSPDHGINGLVQAYLHALNYALDECDGAELPGIIDNFCRLLALACGRVADDQRTAIRAVDCDR